MCHVFVLPFHRNHSTGKSHTVINWKILINIWNMFKEKYNEKPILLQGIIL